MDVLRDPTGRASPPCAAIPARRRPDFDAPFFGSPRGRPGASIAAAAAAGDGVGAVERAESTPTSLCGTRTGVYVGASAWLRHRPGRAARGLAAAAHRTAASVVSGRVSYTLGLRGPALTVDTRARHRWSVAPGRGGRCARGSADAALVAASPCGSPAGFVEFSRQGGLAGTGLQVLRASAEAPLSEGRDARPRAPR